SVGLLGGFLVGFSGVGAGCVLGGRFGFVWFLGGGFVGLVVGVVVVFVVVFLGSVQKGVSVVFDVVIRGRLVVSVFFVFVRE
ncbi:hypothetical protein AAHH78_37570, partial [Burkholderia pseudomallei]